MLKSLIVYASHHHQNTEKLVRHLSGCFNITLVNAESTSAVNYDSYDVIGFASGIDFGKLYPSVTELAQRLPEGKSVYALYTCAKDNAKYGSQIEAIAAAANCRYLGKFGCRGYNTYGPWKIIGGMNKQHPSPQELDAARKFYENILSYFPNRL